MDFRQKLSLRRDNFLCNKNSICFMPIRLLCAEFFNEPSRTSQTLTLIKILLVNLNVESVTLDHFQFNPLVFNLPSLPFSLQARPKMLSRLIAQNHHFLMLLRHNIYLKPCYLFISNVLHIMLPDLKSLFFVNPNKFWIETCLFCISSTLTWTVKTRNSQLNLITKNVTCSQAAVKSIANLDTLSPSGHAWRAKVI